MQSLSLRTNQTQGLQVASVTQTQGNKTKELLVKILELEILMAASARRMLSAGRRCILSTHVNICRIQVYSRQT